MPLPNSQRDQYETFVPPPDVSFDLAVSLAGSRAKLARLLGVTKGMITQWGNEGIPEHRRWQLVALFPSVFVQPKTKLYKHLLHQQIQ